MRNTLLTGLLLLVAAAAGYWIGTRHEPAAESAPAGTASGERKILYWRAPMDPGYRRDGPGKSPMGMDLVPVYADEVDGDDEGVVAIRPAISNSLGVRTAPVAFGALQRNIDTVGFVAYDEDTLSQVTTRVAGWIEALGVKANGDAVESGDLLFELYSPELVNAQQEYVAAVRSANTRLVTASRERLVALGVGADEIERLSRNLSVRKRQRIHADRSGVIADLGVREGSHVTPATPVMAIAAVDTVWVMVEILQRQAAWVAAGQSVAIEFDHRPGQILQGRLDYLYPELDAQTRTLRARVRLDNPSGDLRPNMFAHVQIRGSETEPVIHVPREAVIRGGPGDRVVLALGEGRFRSHAVTTGIEAGDRVAILSGLSGDERVVTSAQFLLDSESNIDLALARMEDPAMRPETVHVDATVEGYRIAKRYITVRHAPIEAWSWPQMSMGFEVVDATLLDGLRLGQQVRIAIQRRGENDYVITEIASEEMP